MCLKSFLESESELSVEIAKLQVMWFGRRKGGGDSAPGWEGELGPVRLQWGREDPGAAAGSAASLQGPALEGVWD